MRGIHYPFRISRHPHCRIFHLRYTFGEIRVTTDIKIHWIIERYI